MIGLGAPKTPAQGNKTAVPQGIKNSRAAGH